MSDTSPTPKSLEELIMRRGGAEFVKDRAYRVTVSDGTDRYVVAKSKHSAALQTCDVERVTDKELVAAAFRLLNTGKVVNTKRED